MSQVITKKWHITLWIKHEMYELGRHKWYFLVKHTSKIVVLFTTCVQSISNLLLLTMLMSSWDLKTYFEGRGSWLIVSLCVGMQLVILYLSMIHCLFILSLYTLFKCTMNKWKLMKVKSVDITCWLEAIHPSILYTHSYNFLSNPKNTFFSN